MWKAFRDHFYTSNYWNGKWFLRNHRVFKYSKVVRITKQFAVLLKPSMEVFWSLANSFGARVACSQLLQLLGPVFTVSSSLLMLKRSVHGGGREQRALVSGEGQRGNPMGLSYRAGLLCLHL